MGNPKKQAENRPARVRAVPDAGPIHVIPRPTGSVTSARPKRRHFGILASLLAFVVVPVVVSAWYLYARAAPQYASYVGFVVRADDANSPIDMLGGLAELGGGGQTRDAEILHEFLASPQIADAARSTLDLDALWVATGDPVFSMTKDRSLEALTRHWQRKVVVDFDPTSGLIQVRATAFSAEGATALTTLVQNESAALVNALSADARADAMAHAETDLARAEDRLSAAREDVARFRSTYQMVDPEADLQAQMGVLASLQSSLAEALIELDLLEGDARAGQFRTEAAAKRVQSIRDQITAERTRLAQGAQGRAGMTEVTSRYESLALEVEFAQSAYVAALANLETARAEAARQNRYLASFVEPTRPERADFPHRPALLLGIAVGLLLTWAIFTLSYYGMRDRR